ILAWLPSLAVGFAAIFWGAVALLRHQRLQPWCPYCGGGGSTHDRTVTAPPAPTVGDRKRAAEGGGADQGGGRAPTGRRMQPRDVLAGRRRHARLSRDWSSDVRSSDLTRAWLPSLAVCFAAVFWGAVAVLRHQRLQPWCPYCGGGGSTHDPTVTAPPAPTV